DGFIRVWLGMDLSCTVWQYRECFGCFQSSRQQEIGALDGYNCRLRIARFG
ncbi:hypothetical protein A2U01_0103619, partial [Trifolium medium]|nr:hypothetical protein [Trifolium medium]